MAPRADAQLGTKGFVPRLAQPWIRRVRLLERLEQASGVAVVSGPPGAGKTALLAEFATQSRPAAMAWLTLDARDNEPGRFGAVLATTLGLDAAAAPGADIDIMLVDDLLAQCAIAAEPRVLLLDDVHELVARPTIAALDHLLLRAPDCLKIVLASRSDPPVSLARLRTEGRLTEIRAGELAFAAEETGELLNAYGVALPAGECTTLRERTEGWAAGLRLAAIALESEPDPVRFVADAARTEALVSDYLLREVFERQTADRQRFLLRTSVVDRMCVELARHLSDDPDPRAQLDALERDGVFLTALDGAPTVFRYHALFGALLRARFHQQAPAEASALTRRAAEWCAANGLPEEAETYALRAGDWDLLGSLMCTRWVETAGSGPYGRYRPYDFPLDAAAQHPALAVIVYARSVAVGDRALADHWRGRTASVNAGTSAELLRDLVDVCAGRTFGIDEGAFAACARVRALPADDDDERRAARRAAMLVAEAELRLGAGEIEPATDLLTKARSEASQVGAPWVADEAASWIALIAASRGHLRDAEKSLIDRSSPDASGRDVALIAEALVHAARGRGARYASEMATVLASRPTDLVRRAAALVANAVDARAATSIEPIVHPFLQSAALTLGAFDLVPDTDATHPSAEIDAQVVAAVTADRANREPDALIALRSALDAAAIDDLRGPFLQHRGEVVGLLERYAWQLGPKQGYAVEILEDLRRSEPPAFVEPLTDRELAVLQYLPTMMSNVEIAGELYVSVNTVKTHLKAVYRKLGVERRRDAVLRARQLDII